MDTTFGSSHISSGYAEVVDGMFQTIPNSSQIAAFYCFYFYGSAGVYQEHLRDTVKFCSKKYINQIRNIW